MKLVTAHQMREIDRVAIHDRGISGTELMEMAGRAIALDVAESLETGSVAILCGKGNNGGDGFVAARYLAQAGWRVIVVYLEEPKPGTGDARAAWERLPEGIELHRIDKVQCLTKMLSGMDAAIDALLGTGTKGRPRPPFDGMIEALNEARIPVFAADIPSGLDPDRGTAEVAVRAWRTITMGLPKVGMVTAEGPAHCGGIRVEALRFPADLLDAVDSPLETLTPAEAAALLPERGAGGHKGTFGLAAIVAGSAGMPGAAVLAGLGALRGGCGLVRMVVPESIMGIVGTKLPEAIFYPIPPGGPVDTGAILDRARAVGIGPGIGRQPEMAGLLREFLEQAGLAAVLDADALNLVADDRELRRLLAPRHILTPHPGEMARLLGVSIQEIESDRWAAVRRASREFNAVVLLKGHGTLVGEPSGRATHIGPGNTAWARGGAGDVLTGVVASLLAQGMAPANAARLGAFVHGMAADVYTRDRSARGALTRDVAECLPTAFRELERLESV